MRSRTRVVALISAVLLLLGCTAAVAIPVPNPDPCDAKYASNTIANLRAYDDCRFDRIEQGIPGNQTVTVAGQDGPVNLTSATKIEVVGYRDGVEVLRRVVTGDAQGKVVMPWQTGDTGVGTLGVRWEVTWPGERCRRSRRPAWSGCDSLPDPPGHARPGAVVTDPAGPPSDRTAPPLSLPRLGGGVFGVTAQ